MTAFTNVPREIEEALEKWSVPLFQKVLPRHLQPV